MYLSWVLRSDSEDSDSQDPNQAMQSHGDLTGGESASMFTQVIVRFHSFRVLKTDGPLALC